MWNLKIFLLPGRSSLWFLLMTTLTSTPGTCIGNKLKETILVTHSISLLGRYSSVGIATRYGLDGPGIEFRWGARFSANVQTIAGAYPVSYTMGAGSFPGVKRPGRGVDHPPPSSVEVKERVELYLYSPSGPSCLVIR